MPVNYWTESALIPAIIPIRHYSNQSYFEKMSAGAIYNRKALPVIAAPLAGTGIAVLATTSGVLSIVLAKAAAALGTTVPALLAAASTVPQAAGIVTAGTVASATGIGAGAVGGALLCWLSIAGVRTKMVMNKYKQSFNRLADGLMNHENENMVSLYLHTKSVSSAKKKARKKNEKTLAYLEGRKANPDNVFKIYVRHSRNQNKVFVTRSRKHAYLLLDEANRIAAERGIVE
jgi:hypothetical protein